MTWQSNLQKWVCKFWLKVSPKCNILLYNRDYKGGLLNESDLIVDDEAAIAMLVRRILTEAGYRCQAVTDSRAAANLLERTAMISCCSM